MDLLNDALKTTLRQQLEPHGQAHVLRFWEALSDLERRQLAAEIDALDLDALASAYRSGGHQEHWAELARRAGPPPAVPLEGVAELPAEEARRRGEQALRDGRVGMILVAGGQGSRLGFEHPKGMYPIGPVSGCSLFAILIERLRARARRYGGPIPLYLMTSPATHEETVDFLERQRWCGLPPDEVRVFCQGTMPALDAETGRLLLAEKGRLFLSPDGHGGMLRAMHRQGCLADAAARGIRHLFYGQIDNPLTQVCDPELIGYHILRGSEMTTQVVRKREPLERVGNLVEVDGQVRIIEYSDLPEEAARRRAPDGRLELWAGNMAVHIFERAFLERAASRPESLPWHRARKVTPYVDEQGTLVTPSEPNAFKFERFIFDLLPLAENALAVEADKSEAFAPVKNDNSRPADSPATAQAAMTALHRRWLREAGAEVADEVPVEISPLWALDAQETARKVTAGTVIAQARYFGPEPVENQR